MAVSLHDSIGQQHDGIENDTDAQHGHQTGGKGQLFAGVATQQRGNGLRQHRKTHSAGGADQSGDPGSGFFRGLDGRVILQRQLGGNGGDDRNGNGGNEGAGHIEDLLGEVVDTLLDIRLLLGHGLQELTHVDLGLQNGEDLQARGADGDGNGNGQKSLGDILAGRNIFGGPGDILVGLAEAVIEIQRRQQAAHGHAEDSAGCGEGFAIGVDTQQNGSGDAHYQFANSLQNLRNGGGFHVALTLEEAAVGAHQADEEAAGTQGADGGPCVGLLLELRKLFAENRHKPRTDETEGQENGA